MNFTPDHLLGRDVAYTDTTARITITAHDPQRGYHLRGKTLDAWVPLSTFRWMLNAGLLSFMSLMLVASASAQSLRTPTAVFATAAAADWISTYRGLSAAGITEDNKMLAFANSRRTPTVLAGAAMDVAGVLAWNRYVGRKHPRVALVGLYTMAAFRLWLAARNTQRLRAWRAR